MARVFLDANIVIDLVGNRKDLSLNDFGGNKLFISPLSIHILSYSYKYKIPNDNLSNSRKYFTITPFDAFISTQALTGPTNDFEDNVQLHSAAHAECDIFLTSDKKLLAMKFFGKTRIASSLK